MWFPLYVHMRACMHACMHAHTHTHTHIMQEFYKVLVQFKVFITNFVGNTICKKLQGGKVSALLILGLSSLNMVTIITDT